MDIEQDDVIRAAKAYYEDADSADSHNNLMEAVDALLLHERQVTEANAGIATREVSA